MDKAEKYHRQDNSQANKLQEKGIQVDQREGRAGKNPLMCMPWLKLQECRMAADLPPFRPEIGQVKLDGEPAHA